MFVAELHNYGATPATKVSIAMNAVFTSTPPTFMVDETKLTSHYVVRDIPEQEYHVEPYHERKPITDGDLKNPANKYVVVSGITTYKDLSHPDEKPQKDAWCFFYNRPDNPPDNADGKELAICPFEPEKGPL